MKLYSNTRKAIFIGSCSLVPLTILYAHNWVTFQRKYSKALISIENNEMSIPVGFPCSVPPGHHTQQKNKTLRQQEHVFANAYANQYFLIFLSSYYMICIDSASSFRFCQCHKQCVTVSWLKMLPIWDDSKLKDKHSQGGLCCCISVQLYVV